MSASTHLRRRDRLKTARRQRFLAERRHTSLWGEMLEPRLMMAVDTPDIVVGRTLSAYSIADVQNNELKVTYTVYNQEAEDVTGVLLTTTLQPGVTLADATQLPDQNGQELAWSLGTIPAYGQASVEVTVELANNTVLTIDDGAEAFSTLNARASTDAAPPTILKANPLPAALLASTIDANTTDPFIQEQAARLDYDPQNIIDFLQDEIGFESYTGSLRGARGTLWSSAGNALDEASLGVALFRASGIPAQYAAGTLSDPLAQQLILSMFPESYQLVGHIPTGSEVSDPTNDPQLLAETKQHYWIQFDAGGGLQNIDTTFANSTIGQTFTSTSSTFSEVADGLRHKVQVKLDAETWNQAATAFGLGDGLSTRTVLDHTFNAVGLVGRPLTVGNYLSGSAIGAILVSQTKTYTPYLEIPGNTLDQHDDTIIRGAPFQEVLTNFPLGNVILTGLFINVTLTDPAGGTHAYKSVMGDRIGVAAREGFGGSVVVDPQAPPLITPYTLTTLDISAARQESNLLQRLDAGLGSLRQELLAHFASQDPESADSTFDPFVLAQLIASSRLTLAQYKSLSDLTTALLARNTGVVAYADAPRIAIVKFGVAESPTGSVLTEAVDLRRNDLRVIAAPGQSIAALYAFQNARGGMDTFFETAVLSRPADEGGTVVAPPVSADTIVRQALTDNIDLVTLLPADIAKLDGLQLTDGAHALISRALAEGHMVIVPRQAVTIGSTTRSAWYQSNLTTGETIGVLDDGGHQAITEQTPALLMGFGIGLSAGFIPGLISFPLGKIHPALGLGSSAFGGLRGIFSNLSRFAPGTLGFFFVGFSLGFLIGNLASLAITNALHIDPPLPSILLGSDWSTRPGSSASSAAAISASRLPGVTTGLYEAAATSINGQIAASWNNSASSSFPVQLLSIGSATVTGQNGQIVGSGILELAAATPIAATVSGSNSYTVNGAGNLSFYGPAESSLGVSGVWETYSANVSGNVSIQLTTEALRLNGTLLPAGTYTIATTAATLSGSGPSSSPNFSGAASITATSSTIVAGPGTGNITIGGNPVPTDTGFTLTGYDGTVNITANGNQDSVALSGNSAQVLRIDASPTTLSADQNTPATFTFQVQTSLADTYSLTAIAPEGWTVTINNNQVTVTPKPGTQSGNSPVRIVARSQSNPDLVATADVIVTVTPTAPGLDFDVIADSTYTVPFNGAQIPTSFQATMQNLGPATDTFDLTFPNPPAGFNILRSANSLTVPPGETGITGIYLEPNGVLPAPGTSISFTVTATSRTNPLITQTETFTFQMPAVSAVTVEADPAAVSTIPGAPVTANVTIKNVGNVPYNLAIGASLPNGLTLSGLTTPVMLAVGQSTTQVVTLTPAAGTPLNTTLTPTFTYGPAVAANQATVVQIDTGDAFVEAGQAVSVSADVFAGVLQAQQGSIVYVVKNAQGTIVQTSAAIPLALGVVAATQKINLGTINTTGFASGEYTIEATVRDANNVALPGALGIGKFVVGLPISAVQDVSPNTVAEGLELTYVTNNATVESSVLVSLQPLVSIIDTNGTALNIALSGNLAYVAGTKDVTIIDLANPASPQIVGSFGAAQLSQDSLNVAQIVGGNLVIGSQSTVNANNSNIIVYSLANPLAPTLVSNTSVPYRFITDLLVQGNTAVIPTSGVSFTLPGTIIGQFGDVVTVNLSNPASPSLADVLFNTNGSPNGGTTRQTGGTIVSSSLAYIGSSTFTGSNTTTGSGRVLIVNITNPASITVAGELQIPGVKQVLDIAIDGNRALVVGSSGGLRNPFNGFGDLGLDGTLTLTVLDITNPNSPTILGTTLVTDAEFGKGIGPGLLQAVALGGQQFAVSGVQVPQQGPVLVVVDASNPADVQARNLDVPAAANGLSVNGNFLHVSSAAGLATYRIDALVEQSVQVAVQVPTGTGVAVAEDSFNIAPSQVIAGAGFETLVWNLALGADNLAQELTWNSDLTGLTPGTSRAITLGATIDYGGTTADLTLPAQLVAATPATQTLQLPVLVVVPGADAIASASVSAAQAGQPDLANRLSDLATALTNLVQDPTSAVALSQSLASIDAVEVLIAADPFLRQLADELAVAQATLAAATTPTEVQAAVVGLGTVLEALDDLLRDVREHGFELSLLQNVQIVQPNTSARFDVYLRNTGTQTTTYDFAISGLPASASAAFDQTSVTLAPGEAIGVSGATQDVFVSLTQTGSSLAAFGFTLTATAREAPLLVRQADAALALRNEFIGVASVALSTFFVQQGTSVGVTANVVSAVNSPTPINVYYQVRNEADQIVFTSPDVAATLTVAAPLESVPLAAFVTTTLADGTYKIEVIVEDEQGIPIPGATAFSTLLVGTPLSANLTVSERGGLTAEFFDLATSPSVLPNLTGLTPDVVRLENTIFFTSTSGAFPGLDSRFADTFASRFTGYINIPADGSYTFYLTSDDGSKMWLDGAQIINNDGLHGMVEVGATRTLTAGFHEVRIEQFEGTGNAGLILGWEGPGIIKQVVPERVLFTEPVQPGSSVSLPAGTHVVNNRLQITSQAAFTNPLTFLGLVDTNGLANSVVTYGSVAYVSGSSDISIVDISNPTNPQVLSTFAGSLIVQNGFNVSRIVGDKLIVGSTVTLNANGFNVLIYDLADPLNPTLISNTPINYRFISDFLTAGTTVLATTNGVWFFGGGDIFDQFGDVVSLDITNLAAPSVGDALFNNRGAPDGGNFRNLGGTFANNTTAYIASTTVAGGNTQDGVGRVLVVDTTNPANLSLVRELQIPGTVHIVDVAVQGNRGLAVGTTGGAQDPFNGTNDGFTGNLSLTLLDTSDPLNPTIIGSTLVTAATFPRGSIVAKLDAVSLGNGSFAVSLAIVDGQPVLVLVDPSDPLNMAVSFSPMPVLQNGIEVVGNKLYTTSSAGLSIFEIGDLQTVPLTASVQIPNGTGVSIVPGSFNIAPSQIIPGPIFDTLVWNRTLAFGTTNFDFTWQTTVTNLSPNEIRNVTLTAQIDSGLGSSGDVQALNLSNWTVSNLIDPAAPSSNWVQSNNNTQVEQTVNAVPAMLVSDFDVTAARIEGTFRVNTSADDDFIGFVFGYQDNQHFYLFDWKQVNQTVYGFGERGMTLKVVNAATPVTGNDLWPTAGVAGRVTTLFHNTVTYADFTDYQFSLQFTPGVITIEVRQGATLLESFTVNDSTYTSGKFGFYNYSQPAVVYTGFTRQTLFAPLSVTLPGTTAIGLPGSEIELQLTPLSQTLQPGDTTNFTVTVNNPNATAGTFDLEVAGLPASWVTMASSVNVPAMGSAQVPLQIATDVFASLGDLGFTVIASTGALQGYVQGSLEFVGPPRSVDPQAHGVVASLTQSASTAGQGVPATFTLRLTNTGSATDTFNLAATLPPGFTVAFEQTSVVIPPGASNFREITVQVIAPLGTAAGDYPFTLTATSATLPAIAGAIGGTVNVVTAGVAVALNPAAGPAGSVFQLTVTNTDTTTDTFSLALAGPGALVSTLAQSSVTLAPGASQVVNVNVAAIDFAVQPSLQLAAIATSQNNAAIKDLATANITIPLTFGMSSEFEEDTLTLAAPGPGTFLLLVDNLGNGEDAYEATIIGSSGPISGALIGLDGSAVQTVPIFRLPGLSTGAIVLNVNLADLGQGTITVRVRSLTNGNIVSQSTAVIQTTTNDFGDAPDSYSTTLASNGPRHLAVGPQLGNHRNPEADGQPSTGALADDNTGLPDDEDGVTLPGLFVAGSCDCSGTGLGNQIIVNATGGGYVDAWIDFNRDGDFDANEKVANSIPVLAGANAINVTVPESARAGLSYARFRISSTGGLAPTGAANDGEVEDYAIQIFNPGLGTAGLIVDPNNAAANVLYVKGTEFADAIVVRQTSPAMVTVYIAPQVSIGSYNLASFQMIVVCGMGGPDAIAVESPITKPTVLYGNDGPDAISGGSGPDIIFGGDSVDALAGNAGDDIISGGPGTNDSLVGGTGFDRLWEVVSGQVTLTSTHFKVGGDSNTIGFFEAATLVGGNASDSFNIGGWPFPVTIEGGGGTNTIIDSGNGNFTLTTSNLTRLVGGVTRIATFTSIQNANLTGGTGNNSFNLTAWPFAATLSGAAGTDSFLVTGDVDYTLSDAMLLRPNLGMIRLSGFENASLNAGESDNTFTVTGWTKAGTLSGAGGTDKVISVANVNHTLSNTSLARAGRGTLTLSSIEQAELTGGAGNNTLSAAAFSGQVKLDGGGGNDTLTSGAGLALLLGGAGNDTLRAGTGRAVMIGGVGLDRLTGGSNDDLLIAGQTVHDANAAALALILAEWASNSSYADRLAHLTGTPGGLNGGKRLDGANVLHDTAIDILLGGLGNDLFFAKLTNPAKDTLGDKAGGETAL